MNGGEERRRKLKGKGGIKERKVDDRKEIKEGRKEGSEAIMYENLTTVLLQMHE